MVKKKILITGSNGFIGSYLVRCLKKTDYSLIPLTSKQIDIRDPKIKRFFKGVDIVVHLAAIGENYRPQNLSDFLDINVFGTINLLEAAKNTKIEKFIFASSTKVYGKPLYFPIDEEHPLLPQTFYAVSKALAEENCSLYKDLFDVICLRFSNVYGPGNKKGVVYNFLRGFLKKTPIEVRGGSKKINLIYVDDVISAIRKSIEVEISEVFNICSDDHHSVKEVCEFAKEISGSETQIRIIKEKQFDSILSNKKAKKILEFYPKVNLREGMIHTWKWLRRNQSIR